jgi:hypothetical protein
VLFCSVWFGFVETGSHYIAQAGLEITMYSSLASGVILLPLPLKCWDYKCNPLCPVTHLFSLVKYFNNHVLGTWSKRKRYVPNIAIITVPLLNFNTKKCNEMATLKTNNHKMAEFTISFFLAYITHSFKNYLRVSSAFLRAKGNTKDVCM